ncbi:MAG TPA: putative quinol monooxygenase [Deltaproteobacteria bacterium]|nr:putative quinol monooxygenase [Deltaproteobacteria bacterium]HPR54452.1 putative quinol monooxygenase [Deltaproteobacteria bacterium]HXK46219.1 putative quinol monooxygenase [Deltaproteobacteria bacterium]
MIVVVAVMKAQQGKEKEMEDALRAIVPQVDAEEGTLQYILHRARKDPGKFILYEKYRDKEALNVHSATPHFADLFARIGPLLDGAPTIDVLEELASIKTKG